MGTNNLIPCVHVFKISTRGKYCPTAAPFFHWPVGLFAEQASLWLSTQAENGWGWGLRENLLHSLADVGRVCCILGRFDLCGRNFALEFYGGDDNGLRDRFLDCVFSVLVLSTDCISWSGENINTANLWDECWAVGCFWTVTNNLDKECRSNLCLHLKSLGVMLALRSLILLKTDF